jgi:hypothetical protein
VGSANDDRCWEQPWKVKCPQKMLHFLWRLGHNSLALRVNLRRRGMKLDTRCFLCGRMDEDGGHLFFKCKQVRGVWRDLQLEQTRIHLASVLSAKGVVEEIRKLQEDVKCKVITLLYLWWSERCGCSGR